MFVATARLPPLALSSTGFRTTAAPSAPAASDAARASATSVRGGRAVRRRTRARIPANHSGQNERYPASAQDGTGGAFIVASAYVQYTSPAAQQSAPTP